jgi:hypothetical protein
MDHNMKKLDICKYVDKFITCRKPSNSTDPDTNLVSLQTDRHSNTCKKKNVKACRFGFPKPPMRKTAILQPLTEPEFSRKEKEKYRKIYHQIEEFLYKSEDEEMTFDEFLRSFNLTEEEYIRSVRSSIKTATVMLKRTIAENCVDNYNATVLDAWRADIDVQFIWMYMLVQFMLHLALQKATEV